MSAQNSSGIQTLLNAEQDAQKVVQKARTYRTQRIKDARAEAAKEIEAYKAQKEDEFRRFQAEHSGASAKAEQEAAKEAEAALHRIKLAGEQHGHRVVEDLIKGVTEVHPVPHRNLEAAAKTA